MDAILKKLVDDAAEADGVPVLLLTKRGEKLWLVMPDGPNAHRWLGEGRSRWPQRYVKGKPFDRWLLPKAWFNAIARRLAERFGGCYIVQARREMEKCARACWTARGIDCECSCMGEHHGEQSPGGRWYEVSETCAFTWGEHKLHYKLLTPR